MKSFIGALVERAGLRGYSRNIVRKSLGVGIFSLLSLLAPSAGAASRFWVATATTAFSSTAGWSASSGGASGASVPGASDTAIFDGAGGANGDCTIGAVVSVTGISISGYTGTITNTTFTITVGSGGFSQSSGTFNGGSGAMSTSSLSLTGGAFNSTTGTLTVTGNFTNNGGSFTHNSGTVAFTNAAGGSAIDVTTATIFSKITFNGAGTATITGVGGFTAAGLLTLTSGSVSGGTITAKGDVTSTGSVGGTAAITLSGVTQTFTTGGAGHTFPTGTFTISPTTSVTLSGALALGSQSFVVTTGTFSQGANAISGSGALAVQGTGIFTGSASAITAASLSVTGGTFTSTSGTLTLTGNFTHNGGTFTHNSGTVAFNDTAPSAIDVTTATIFQNVSFGGNNTATISGAGGFTVAGTLTLASGSVSGGTITANGAVTSTGSVGGTAGITFSGGTQTFTTGGAGHTFPTGTFTISPSTSVTLSGALALGSQSFVVTTGTFSQGANAISGTGALAVQGTGIFTGSASAISAASLSVTGGTFTSTSGTLTLTGNFTHNGGTFTHNSGTVAFNDTAASAIDVTTATSFQNVSFAGSNTATISGAGGFTVAGTLTLGSGSVSGGPITANGNVTFTGDVGGNVALTLSGGAPIFSPGGHTLPTGDINLNPGTSVTLSTGLKLGTGQNLFVNSGNFSIASLSITGGGNITINNTGTLTANSSGSVSSASFTVNTGGTYSGSSSSGFTVGSLSVAGGSFTYSGSQSISVTGAGGLTVSGGTFTFSSAGATTNVSVTNGLTISGTGIFTCSTTFGNGLTAATLSVSGGTFNSWCAAGGANITVGGGSGAVNLSGGQFIQGCLANLSAGAMTLNGGNYLACNSASAGATGSVTVGALSVSNGSTFDYVGTGTITLGGDVSNSATIRMWGGANSGGSPPCGGTRATLKSSAGGTQRNWSGPGIYTMVDLAVTDQKSSVPITCFNCTASNVGTQWTVTANCTGAPTLVTFNSLTATPCDAGVLVQWRTGYESDNLGFHVYREEGGQRVRLDPSMVAGSAFLAGARTVLPAGNSYSWLDRQGTSSSQYLVEEISLTGRKLLHGAANVNSGGVLPNATARRLQAANLSSNHPLLNQLGRTAGNDPASPTALLEVRAAAAGQPTSTQVNKQYSLASGLAVRLGVQHEGWYHVDASQLFAAGMPSGVNPHTLQLFVNGQEQQIVVQGSGQVSAIEFYGQGLDTTFSDTQVYWLVWGSQNGQRVNSQSGRGKGTAPVSFPATVAWQPRDLYFSGLLNGDADNFFGPGLDPDDPVTQPLILNNLNTATPGSSTLRVTMQGAIAGSHVIGVQLNGTQVGTMTFHDLANSTSAFTVSNSLLVAGANTLTLTAQGGSTDVSVVDTVLLSYPHSYAADSDYLRFTAPSATAVTVGGFSNNQIQVMDITDPANVESVQGTVASQGAGFAVSFSPAGGGTRTLLAFTTAKESQPVSVTANHPSSWHTAQAGADMVILSHANFISSLGPLQALRQSQGHTVAVIDVQDAYDEFNFGAQSPYALKSLLSTANSKWQKKPRWVLLVGDGNLDPHNYLGTGVVDYVPVELVGTTLLETADDDWFADFNNTGIPLMAVGRLPVTSAAEASALVSKIVTYDKAGAQTWKNKVLLVAGASDSENNFDGYTAAAQALLPASVTVQTILEDKDGNARNDLLAALNSGQGLVNFVGHGSVEVWTTDGLLSSTDATSLTNGATTPLVLAMTCLNGFFQDVYTFALAKAFIEAPGGGAVAVWASSALTNSGPQSTLDQAMIKALYGGTSQTIGEAAINAKKAVTDPDTRVSWILFGDPSMKLR